MGKKSGERLLSSLADTISQASNGLVELEGVTGPAKAAVLADVYRETGEPVVAVVSEEDEARTLVRQLGFLLGEDEEAPEFYGDRTVALLLPDELSPYESRKFLPERARRMETMATLYALSQPFRPAITITTAWGLLKGYVPKRLLESHTEYVLSGADIDRDATLLKLTEAGYTHAPMVEDPGTFSARGGIVDVFSPLYRWPVRLDFFGDTLESLRLFNPSTQKSVMELEEAYLIPVREIMLSPEIRRRGSELLEKAAIDHGALDRKMQNMLNDLDEGLYSTDLDPFAPLFYEEMAPLFAYMSSRTRLFIDNPDRLLDMTAYHWKRLAHQYSERNADTDLALDPGSYIADPDGIWERVARTPRILSHKLKIDASPEGGLNRFSFDDHELLKQELLGRRGRAEVLEPLLEAFRNWLEEGYTVFLIAHTEQQLRRLAELLEPHNVKTSLWLEPFPAVWHKVRTRHTDEIHLITGALAVGQVWEHEKVVFLTEEEIFGPRKRRRAIKHTAFDKGAFLSSLEEITEGDFIVHVEFGIGVYRGLKALEAGDGTRGDYLHIEYLGNDVLYLPATQLQKVQKFSGAESAVPRLDRLGGNTWQKTKSKVKASLWEMAEQLLKLYAEREIHEGYRFSAPDTYFREFEAAFPYEETPDQEQAIKDVIADMQSRRPMDRLVCGDVGFGKTEVALRAAMKAVLDHKQVAVLVPTTVLALQHEETFRERFANYPVSVEMVSRFKTTAQIKETLAKAKAKKLDIIIGTHRLLSKDVEIPELGLLIVDEEHRFGVAHKEKIKEMSKGIDVVTLTATPIPRTLNMAFSGVRDVSIIQTPPTDRMSIRTFVSKFEEDVIREAVSTELGRGGQVFFVHNRVGSIDAMSSLVKRLVPSARISIGHGQMSEKQLESVMLDFIQKRTNVLVSTTIIESGIDIPSCNTMVINRADTFGLAQLYQLRGRVGRGRERAYCYLLVPSPSNLTKDAQKRLAALMRFTDLGSGFRIASHDLEIRGAGNLLGKQQSGHIAAIGIDLYMQLLDEVINELKGKRKITEVEPQINIFTPAYLPDDYIPDQNQRLGFYKRMSSAADEDEIDSIVSELQDRYGRLPEASRRLADAIELKVLMRRINAATIDLTPNRIGISLGDHCTLDPTTPMELATRRELPFQFSPEMKLSRKLSHREMMDPIGAAKNILRMLADYGTKTSLERN